MRQEPSDKPIATFWFYLFAAFFGSTAIAAFFQPTDWEIRALCLVFFLLGALFLFEPLERKNLLPPFLLHVYHRFIQLFRTQKRSIPSGMKGALVVTFLLCVLIAISLTMGNSIIGTAWSATRIYLIGVFILYAVMQLILLLAVLAKDIHAPFIQWTKAVAHFEPLLTMETSGSLRSTWIGLFSTLLGVSGFIASIGISSGNIIAPLALIVMVLMSFGQMMVFGKTESVRVALDTELKAAHDMQLSLMPIADPEIPGFDISGSCWPALEVGGDYYDYVWLDQQKTKLGIAIADVSGKAMKAAMTAVMTSGMIYREIESNSTPRIILQGINKPMYLKTSKQVFTALSFGVIDIPSKQLLFSNAGQMNPLLKRGNEIISLKVSGSHLPLGVIREIQYNELTEQLQSGDLLLFYTDGIPEAMNEKKELFGFERLEKFVHELNTGSTSKETIHQLLAAVQMHMGTALQHDDMTVVAVRVM